MSIKVALEHLVESLQGETQAMVGHPVLLVVVRADLLGALAAAHLGPTGSRHRSLLFVQPHLIEAGPEDPERLFLVLKLGLLVLAGHDQAGWHMSQANRRVGGIDRLAAWAL